MERGNFALSIYIHTFFPFLNSLAYACISFLFNLIFFTHLKVEQLLLNFNKPWYIEKIEPKVFWLNQYSCIEASIATNLVVAQAWQCRSVGFVTTWLLYLIIGVSFVN